jgi:hypothetical protein
VFSLSCVVRVLQQSDSASNSSSGSIKRILCSRSYKNHNGYKGRLVVVIVVVVLIVIIAAVVVVMVVFLVIVVVVVVVVV